MKMPEKGDELVSAQGVVWLVLRRHMATDDPGYFAVDLIMQKDLKHTSRSVNLTWDEFEDFCRKEGIAYPLA